MEKKRRVRKDFNVIIVDPEKISERLTRVISDYFNNTVIEPKKLEKISLKRCEE